MEMSIALAVLLVVSFMYVMYYGTDKGKKLSIVAALVVGGFIFYQNATGASNVFDVPLR